MKAKTKRKIFWLLVGCTVVIAGVGIFLPYYLEKEIAEKINLHHARATSIHIDIFSSSIIIEGLQWHSDEDSTNAHQHFLGLPTIKVNDISLYDLVFHNTFLVEEVVISGGRLRYNERASQLPKKKSGLKFKRLFIKNISLRNVEIKVLTDTVVNFSALLNGSLAGAVIEFDSLQALHYTAKNIIADVDKIRFNRQGNLYRATIERLHLDTKQEMLTLDSALLIPNYGKYEFAHHVGEQISRVNLSIPHLIMKGVRFDKLSDSAFVVSKVEINLYELFVFKDRRVPFRRKHNVPLPMESFLKFPWLVKVDTILIKNSLIRVEEFPEKGNASGTVTFRSINAAFTGINNRIQGKDPHHAYLNATGLLMGRGLIKAQLSFPLDGSPIYQASGSLSEMPFAELDPILTPMAHLRIKSGRLNKLTFNFQYTEWVSNGHIDLDYENLHIISLNSDNHSVNEVRTFLINAIVKNNKHQTWSPYKRAGTIQIERDRKRYIFNVWCRSILDGLKSSF